MDATEVTGTINGSTITPSTAPAGLTGKVVVNAGGSVNYTPAQVANGAYFLNCCGSNSAYYKFTGAALGNVFNVNQGQITFYLKSRYSFSNRVTQAPQPRYAFDVRDGDVNNHLFYFFTQVSYANNEPYLVFTWRSGNGPVNGYLSYFLWVDQSQADALFGNGVILKVTIKWNGSSNQLYFNNVLVATIPLYSPATPNWTAASNFDVGAFEYQTYGGYNASDDVIDEFTVLPQ